jgi:anti-sigma regulatory factor (Ser/Thr protein kinase)
MRAPDMQTTRLHAQTAHSDTGRDLGPFRGLMQEAPFPRSRAGAGRPGERIELELECGPSAAAEARAAIEALEGRADPDALDDLRLLLSEVVTNAVRHAGVGRDAKIGLAVSVASHAVRAEVTDTGGGFEPTPRDAQATEAGGWGLHLVDRLASRWGVVRGAPTRVWFEIDAA